MEVALQQLRLFGCLKIEAVKDRGQLDICACGVRLRDAGASKELKYRLIVPFTDVVVHRESLSRRYTLGYYDDDWLEAIPDHRANLLQNKIRHVFQLAWDRRGQGR